MAMRKCRECKGSVSTKAKSCPHCGAPRSSSCVVSGCLGLLIIITVVVTVEVGSNLVTTSTSQSARRSQGTNSIASAPSAAPKQDRRAVTAPDVYTIIDQDTFPGIRRNLTVRLSRKVTKSELESIALVLKEQDSRTYPRTFIVYYLPGMPVNDIAWATTHFDPDLDVRILGLTIDQEKGVLDAPLPEHTEIMGIWLLDRPLMGCRIVLFRKGGNVYMEERYPDGSDNTKELSEHHATLSMIYREADRTDTSDFWTINRDGDLECYDNQGLIWTARRIE